jgi:hypothetical protein
MADILFDGSGQLSGKAQRYKDMGDGTYALVVYSTGALSWFDVTLTTAQVNAGTSVVVPGIAGKQFYPTFAAMSATGTPTVATVLSLIKSGGGVVLSHAVADLTSGLWAGPTGGTVVTTLLNTALTAATGIVATSAGTLTTTTAMRYVVAGYYI